MLTVHQISRQQLWAVSERLNLGSAWQQHFPDSRRALSDSACTYSFHSLCCCYNVQLAATPALRYIRTFVGQCSRMPRSKFVTSAAVPGRHFASGPRNTRDFQCFLAIKIRTSRQPGYKSIQEQQSNRTIRRY